MDLLGDQLEEATSEPPDEIHPWAGLRFSTLRLAGAEIRFSDLKIKVGQRLDLDLDPKFQHLCKFGCTCKQLIVKGQ